MIQVYHYTDAPEWSQFLWDDCDFVIISAHDEQDAAERIADSLAICDWKREVILHHVPEVDPNHDSVVVYICRHA